MRTIFNKINPKKADASKKRVVEDSFESSAFAEMEGKSAGAVKFDGNFGTASQDLNSSRIPNTPVKNGPSNKNGFGLRRGQKPNKCEVGTKSGALRSDMAAELMGDMPLLSDPTEIKKSRVEVDKSLSRKLGKAEGTYLTIETGIVALGLSSRYNELADALAKGIRELTPKAKNVLVVCLGNPALTADALGSCVFNNLIITRHLPAEFKPKASVAAVCPNVMGATGIESFDIIKGVVDRIKPQVVIAVDSLASATVKRIASAFQLCSSGITPGSGVANHRVRLDKSSLGVDVVSIGVPLVVYATTIIAEAAGDGALLNVSDEIRDLIVTPKDIDLLVGECGKVIAAAINKVFVTQ